MPLRYHAAGGLDLLHLPQPLPHGGDVAAPLLVAPGHDAAVAAHSGEGAAGGGHAADRHGLLGLPKALEVREGALEGHPKSSFSLLELLQDLRSLLLELEQLFDASF